jgi:NAD(P)-dependent dehydrogenase (short-subunit alcohol dehydrogenase family)
MKELKGKVAVVTGAASGIGLALCKQFAAEGMRLVMADIEAQALERARAELPAGTEALTVVTDVADAAQMDALADKTIERFGAVHVVCNNAGVGAGGAPIRTTSVKDWQWVLGVNLWGVIHGVRVFAPHLVKQNEGHIVNTASMAGLISAPGLGAYNVSKHGVVTLSETLWSELRGEGSEVSVSVLCPGFVNTRIHESERNRPSGLQEAASAPSSEEELKAAEARRAQGAALIAAGQPPERVAAEVVAAIRERRFYILTHPEMRPLIEQRMRDVLDGRDPSLVLGRRRERS